MPLPFEIPTSSTAIACNSTLTALVQSAAHKATNEINLEQAFAAANCQYSSTNVTLAFEAKRVWEKVNSYGYAPSTGWAIFAIAVFAVSFLFHLYQLVRSRRWSYSVVLFGAALQVFGWVERCLAASDITLGYVEQLAVLTIAPTFFSAAIYSLFSMTAAVQDPSLLPLMKPRGYFITFAVIDFSTLIIQAAGGAMAAITDDTETFNTGCNIMLAGIILQLITTLAFLSIFVLYFLRLNRTHPRRHVLRLKTRTGAVFWGTLVMAGLIIIRGCYRTAELAEGLWGEISQTQIALILADCVPMMLVILLLNATHPLYTVNPLEEQFYASPTEQRLRGERGYSMEPLGRGDSADKV
ncbi:phospholipid-translocating ATPase rsb1 [Rhodotorula kratochvilovae]